jgi:hypothetical protein
VLCELCVQTSFFHRLSGRTSHASVFPASISIRFHSASVTGMTDSREIRTSGNVLNAGSALI